MDCQRRAVFEFGDHPVQPSYAMAVGTVTHAILELRFKGKRGTLKQVEAMKGNYDDPIVAIQAYPDEDVYGIARETADVVGMDVRGYLEEFFGASIRNYGLEFDLETRPDLILADGVDAGGYVDGVFELSDGRVVVWDWKTRSRLDYIPRTEADFRADPQLCYYAAALAKTRTAYGGRDSISVGHGNLLRADCSGGPKAAPILAEIPTWYLASVWDYLGGIADQMKVVMAGPAHEAERNPNHCYKYGPCPHMGYCQSGDRPRKSFFQWAKSTNLDHLDTEESP